MKSTACLSNSRVSRVMQFHWDCYRLLRCWFCDNASFRCLMNLSACFCCVTLSVFCVFRLFWRTLCLQQFWTSSWRTPVCPQRTSAASCLTAPSRSVPPGCQLLTGVTSSTPPAAQRSRSFRSSRCVFSLHCSFLLGCSECISIHFLNLSWIWTEVANKMQSLSF